MKIAIILIFSTILLSTCFSLFVNSLPNAKPHQVTSSASGTDQLNLLLTYSLDNACTVNKDSSVPNCPVRPEGEEYFDGITAELTSERNDPALAKLIINIKSAYYGA